MRKEDVSKRLHPHPESDAKLPVCSHLLALLLNFRQKVDDSGSSFLLPHP